MIKILTSLAIIIICSLIGMICNSSLKHKAILYRQFADFNDKLILNMKYNRKCVDEILQEFSELKEYIKEITIKGGDSFILDYFNNVGKTDSNSQIAYLETKSVEIKEERDKKVEKYDKYGPLYLKLSFMVGILIVVIMA